MLRLQVSCWHSSGPVAMQGLCLGHAKHNLSLAPVFYSLLGPRFGILNQGLVRPLLFWFLKPVTSLSIRDLGIGWWW